MICSKRTPLTDCRTKASCRFCLPARSIPESVEVCMCTAQSGTRDQCIGARPMVKVYPICQARWSPGKNRQQQIAPARRSSPDSLHPRIAVLRREREFQKRGEHARPSGLRRPMWAICRNSPHCYKGFPPFDDDLTPERARFLSQFNAVATIVSMSS
jgi:hypothetical protein